MPKLRTFLSTAALSLGVLGSGPLLADWTLDPQSSSLYYVTSKAAAVSEVNHFGKLAGSISGELATLGIDLGSVSTGIEIRDQRMREIVFDTAMYPSAEVQVPVDTDMLEALAAGATTRGAYSATVKVHGVSTELTAELQITRQADGSLLVTNSKPLLVPASLFGFAEAVEQLREIAGLPSINPNVVLSFSLLYQPD